MASNRGRGRTGRHCLLCSHPDRQGLESALLGGWATLDVLARHYGCTAPMVSYHAKWHMGDLPAQPISDGDGGQLSLFEGAGDDSAL